MTEPVPYRPARPAEVHHPTPIPNPAPLVPVQPGHIPAVQTIVLPDGRVVTGYAIEPAKSEAPAAKPLVSRTAVNIALGGVGFLAACGGLLMLSAFITALTALITQLIVLASVLFGGYIAAQLLSASRGGTTVNIRKAVIKRNHFHT
ncbi:hypothetical protein G6045_26630 [Streptomyces sp. YC504]|uniref:Uncharacterized protein n=1 Tax=Streptomyces mesophilus TaxID=1775132 RepID=A0A6G4XRH0_9ACTN|nr:hypothetical protein [Streptomyces mesophilus]NGO79201.1 hypothetical protein [Streptomyces mesophilus]